MVQQISNRAAALQVPPPASIRVQCPSHRRSKEYNYEGKELKVAAPKKISRKKSGEVYKWFAQLRLVFRGKPRTYHSDEEKIAYALSYMTGVAQNWAMPILQA